MLRRLADLLRGRTRTRYGTEGDVAPDNDQARIRTTGGKREGEQGDDNQTTGTGPNATFVGRASGDDLGYTGDTGAEKRAAGNQNNG